jgi:glycosyltransferase involved in cell wall biosynthesis
VLTQTYDNFELIICDDGSTDGSAELLRAYADKDRRITIIIKENGGIASALNAAFAASRGEIICILDSDDFFTPNKLGRVLQAFQSDINPGFVVHKIAIVDTSGRQLATFPTFSRLERGDISTKVHRRGGRWRFMPASALCLRRDLAEIIFPIPEPLFRTGADAYIYNLAPFLATIESVNEVLSCYRLHGSNTTGLLLQYQPTTLEKALADMERVFRGVNEKLLSLGRKPVDITQNLTIKEWHTIARILSYRATFYDTVKSVLDLSLLVLSDELSSPVGKLNRLFAYWTSLFLPYPARPWWLSFTLAKAPGITKMLLSSLYSKRNIVPSPG